MRIGWKSTFLGRRDGGVEQGLHEPPRRPLGGAHVGTLTCPHNYLQTCPQRFRPWPGSRGSGCFLVLSELA